MELGAVIRESCRWNTAAWMENGGKIRLKNGDLVTPVPNEYQRKITDLVKWCQENGRPCRIVALKPRQKGSSTVSVAVAHVRAKAKTCRGLIAGGAHFQGSNLFNILDTYAANDAVDPAACKVMDMEARYKTGSTIERITLANKNAGRSGTYQVLILTEVAYLADEGVANADIVLNGLLKCVGLEPGTIIIQESTANGANGAFYETYNGGITIEEFKAGKNGYVKIFSPWYEFADSRLEPESEGINDVSDLTVKELELKQEWKLDLAQIAWMRWAIREECKGDFSRFEQDYPFDDESCFLKSGRGRFSAAGLKYQEQRSKEVPREFGLMEYNVRADMVTFRPTTEQEARVVRWEKPRVGCRYIISVDSMTGESQTGGDDPDSHSVLVHRAGFFEFGRWHEPALVCRSICYHDGPRFGCWWDIDVLEEDVWRMARYYGSCPIAPEMNQDRGLVELLKLRPDANIYRREIFNRREGTVTQAYGWMTDPKTRPMVIETGARLIRESGKGVPGEGYEMRCPWLIKQAKNFVVKASGRAEAAQGHHDDDVLSWCIGAQLIDHATPYFEAERAEWLPPDLRAMEAAMRAAGGTKQYL